MIEFTIQPVEKSIAATVLIFDTKSAMYEAEVEIDGEPICERDISNYNAQTYVRGGFKGRFMDAFLLFHQEEIYINTIYHESIHLMLAIAEDLGWDIHGEDEEKFVESCVRTFYDILFKWCEFMPEIKIEEIARVLKLK